MFVCVSVAGVLVFGSVIKFGFWITKVETRNFHKIGALSCLCSSALLIVFSLSLELLKLKLINRFIWINVNHNLAKVSASELKFHSR